MKCETAKPWLLSVRADTLLPEPIARHVDQCGHCRALRRDLGLLDSLADQWQTIPDDGAVRELLDRRLVDVEQEGLVPVEPPAVAVPVYRRHRRKSMPGVTRWVLSASIAMIFLAIGLVIGRSQRVEPLAPVAVPIDPTRAELPQPAPAARSLLLRIAERSSRMITHATASERLDDLMGIADEVRGECLLMALTGKLDEVPALIALYERLLRNGVVPQAVQSQVIDDPARHKQLLKHLLNAEASVLDAQKKSLPGVASVIRPLGTSTRSAFNALRDGMADRPLPAPTASITLLDDFVNATLQLSDEISPLRRAEISTEMAKVLVQATIFLSSAGLADEASYMGQCLDVIMANGVADNLDLVEVADEKGLDREAVSRLRERAGQTVEVLDRNLAEAPAEVQPSLQRAIDAARPGRDKAVFGSKGKGPPFKDGKGKIPPGWLKKS